MKNPGNIFWLRVVPASIIVMLIIVAFVLFQTAKNVFAPLSVTMPPTLAFPDFSVTLIPYDANAINAQMFATLDLSFIDATAAPHPNQNNQVYSGEALGLKAVATPAKK